MIRLTERNVHVSVGDKGIQQELRSDLTYSVYCKFVYSD